MSTVLQPVERGERSDSELVDQAVTRLAPRWALPEHVIVVALTDMAEDLGVDVHDLAGLVVRRAPSRD